MIQEQSPSDLQDPLEIFLIKDEDQTTEDEEVNDTNDPLNGSDDSEEQIPEDEGDWHESNGGCFGDSDDSKEDEEVNDTDASSKGSDDSEDQTTEDEEANDSDDSLNGSDDSEEQTSEDAADWHESNGGWFGGYDSKEYEEVNDTDDSLNVSDDSKEQFPEHWHESNGHWCGGSDDLKEDKEVNDTDGSLKGIGDSKEQTRIEPVTPEEVTDSEFDKFMIALFEVFDANEKEQLPIDDVKMAIFEQTSITEGQFSTCIRKLIDLNEARYIGKVLYLI